MMKTLQEDLSKRERQIMEVVYKHSYAAVGEVHSGIPCPPSYSAVRTTMNILVRKGLLTRTRSGRKYVYHPTISANKAMRSAIKQVMATYFGNSLESYMTALLEIVSGDLDDEDFRRLMRIIEKARKERFL
jgi:predicted transcriptional regulator